MQLIVGIHHSKLVSFLNYMSLSFFPLPFRLGIPRVIGIGKYARVDRLRIYIRRTFHLDPSYGHFQFAYPAHRRMCTSPTCPYVIRRWFVEKPRFFQRYPYLLWHRISSEVNTVDSIWSGNEFKSTGVDIYKSFELQTCEERFARDVPGIREYYKRKWFKHLENEGSRYLRSDPEFFRFMERFARE